MIRNLSSVCRQRNTLADYDAQMGVAIERVFLTIPEVAELMGWSRVYAYHLAAEGLFPSVRLGPRRIRVPRVAFEQWVEEQNERARASVSPEMREPGLCRTQGSRGDDRGQGYRREQQS